MGFSMFSAPGKPIAIDFGSSSIKLLQIEPGEKPALLAAVGVRLPDEIRSDRDLVFGFLETHLPRMVRKGNFKGKRAVCSVPSSDTFIQHMQVAPVEGVERDELLKVQLQAQLGWPPYGMVIRTHDVAAVHRDGESVREVICVAMSRETVMRYVELLKRCRLDVVGVHSEVTAMVNAFVHLHPGDRGTERATLYVDIGWGTTKVAIAHGENLAFARTIQLAGQHLDKRVAERLGCDVATARAHRISEQVLASAGRAATAPDGAATAVSDAGGDAEAAAALEELADAFADELSMCLRYHDTLFRDRRIDRIVFVGGESRNIGLCQRVARGLRLPAQLGDPLSSLVARKSLRTPGLTLGQPQPGWAVVCGLCMSPTDL
jgi:type IV pilus assembly protein PilM